MPRLEITLLGSPQIKLDGKVVDSLPAKGQALLLYLVMTRQQYAREYLAELLWSDESMSLERKLNNLRGAGALLALNQVLAEFLVIHRHSLAFKTESDYWLDVEEFEACLRQPNPTVRELQTAVNLYHDDFLTGQSLREAEGFEDWGRTLKEGLRTQALNALYRLAVHYKEARQHVACLECLTRLLKLNPDFEEAHQEMMLLLAVTGQVSQACIHYETYADRLDADGLEPEQATTALYRKLLRGEVPPELPPPLPAPPPLPTWTPPFQAPMPVRHFVGRQELLAQIVAELQKADSAMVHTLVGMGGVGKSTLAKEIAHAAQEYFEDGVLWASVAVSEPTAVLESWAQAYGYDFSRLPDVESMATAFRGALAEKRVLLVLDDVTSARRIRPLLPNGPGCRVLLTTRDQDLAYALDAKVWPLNELSPGNGRLLLSHILGEARTDAEPEAAAAICGLLQNLPLAVEIIGQRLKSRPQRQLADIVPRLRDEKQRLSELQMSDREVRASFAISYATLDADLRQMFGLMGVFHGRSFTADALAALAAQDRYESEDRIFALTALSLAQADGPTRYRQHPLLSDFAREKLEGGNMGEVYGRFAQHYLTFAQEHPHDYDTLRPEWENLMAAMQAAHDRERWQTVIDFADTLHDGWFVRGRYAQARQGYRNACIAANELGKRGQWANLKLNWGRACIEQSDFDEAADHLVDALGFFEQTKHTTAIGNVQAELARIARDQGKLGEAENLLNTVLLIRTEADDKLGIAEVREGLARIAYRQTDYPKAYELGQETLHLFESCDNRLGILRTLGLLVNCLIERQENIQVELDQAQQYSIQAIKLADELQDSGEKAVALYGLSRVQLKLGDMAPALEQAQQSLTMLEQIGDRHTQAILLIHLSEIQYHKTDYEMALVTAYRSLPLSRELNSRIDVAICLSNIGYYYNKLGKYDQAYEAWSESLAIAEELGHPVLIKRLRKQLYGEG